MFRSLRVKAGAGVMLMVTSVGLAVVAPGSAMATPTGCSAYQSGRAMVGTCTGGSGQFRIRVDCAHGPDMTSPWTKPGKYTSVSCLVGHSRSHTFEVK